MANPDFTFRSFDLDDDPKQRPGYETPGGFLDRDFGGGEPEAERAVQRFGGTEEDVEYLGRGEFEVGAMGNVVRAQELIFEAGGDGQTVRQYLTPQSADLIVAFPSLAELWARKFPRSGASTYEEALADYGFLDQQTAAMAREKNPDKFFSFLGQPSNVSEVVGAVAADVGDALGGFGEQGFVKGEGGAIKFANGVIAATDPTTGEQRIFYPTRNQEDIAGSPGWLQKVRKEWDGKTVKKWRKRLASLGYLSDDEGGMAQDLLGALSTYHRDRYLNGGEVVPYSGSAGAGGQSVKARDVVGPAQLRQRIRGQYQQVFGRQPSDSELDSWGDFFMGELRRELKQGRYPTRAAGEAEARFQEEFETDPKVESFIADEEENTEVRDGLLNLAQTMNAMARL